MTFLKFGITSNHLANSFSSDLIPHLHGTFDAFTPKCTIKLFFLHHMAGLSRLSSIRALRRSGPELKHCLFLQWTMKAARNKIA